MSDRSLAQVVADYTGKDYHIVLIAVPTQVRYKIVSQGVGARHAALVSTKMRNRTSASQSARDCKSLSHT
jgi:hypothetical protein